MQYKISLFYGLSRRKTYPLDLSLSEIIQNDSSETWTYRVIYSGAEHIDKTLEGNSAFDCLTLGLAFLRQSLRRLLEDQPGTIFYFENAGKLEEMSVDDIFWTHDCIPEEIECK
jgi:hypothetical protein